MKTDLEALMRQMQEEMAKALLAKIKSGEATAAELNVARQLLKDNGIDTIPKKGDPMHNLVHSLPFTGDEDDEPTYRN